MQPRVRGSQKHILDWTSVGREAFVPLLNELLDGSGAVVGPADAWLPQGWRLPAEGKLTDVAPEYLDRDAQDALADWWLAHRKGANVPNWDLLATCLVEGRKGLVLIEAKAHASELDPKGKPLDDSASKHSGENHKRIGQAIEEARATLDAIAPGMRISRDSHYQLSNRVAWSWKLASIGVPVVLVYLGFIGDIAFTDYFRDNDEWLKVMRAYARGVLPADFEGKHIDCGDASMQLVLRPRPVLKVSPSA